MSTNILVPLDGSAFAEHALPTAISLANRSAARLELAVVHEPEPFDGLRDAPWNAMTQSMRDRYLTDKAAQMTATCDQPVGHALLRGDVSEEISRRARSVHADLIVMCTHGRTGLTRALAGSVADEVIRESGVPVLVLRRSALAPPTHAPTLDFERILVLDDGSKESNRILDAACRVARRGTTRFLVLRVVTPVHPIPDPSLPFGYLPEPADGGATAALTAEAREESARFAAQLEERSGCLAEVHVVVDEHPSAAIVEFAKQHAVDLIAMTTHGRGTALFYIEGMAGIRPTVSTGISDNKAGVHRRRRLTTNDTLPPNPKRSPTTEEEPCQRNCHPPTHRRSVSEPSKRRRCSSPPTAATNPILR